jgi:hypothetical protein
MDIGKALRVIHAPGVKTKVYVVTSGEWCGSTDEAHLYAVFSTELAAEEYAKKSEADDGPVFSVTEVELDVPLAEAERLV